MRVSRGLVFALFSVVLFSFAIGYSPAKNKGEAVDVNLANDGIERVTIQGRIAIDEPRQFALGDIYTVPDGKTLLVDYVSLEFDVVVIDDFGQFEKMVGKIFPFVLGTMDEITVTTRGTPNFFLSKQVDIAFAEGTVLRLFAGPEISNVNVDFGVLDYALSARLVDTN